MSVNSGFARVNGTKLYYEMSGEGHPLFLLHSGYTDLRIWEDQINDFAKYFKVISYDIRGFGRSDQPDYSFFHVEDLYELAKFLEIDRGYFLGVSMGAGIAIDFTLEHPEMVDSLILSSPSVNGYRVKSKDVVNIPRVEAGLSIIKKDGNFEKSIEILLDDPMWKQSEKNSQDRLQKIFLATSLKWILKDYIQHIKPSAVERITEIQTPTLIIVGDRDSNPIHENSHFLESNLKDVKKIIIKDTGHLPNMDKPTEFNNNLLDFLLNQPNSQYIK